MAFGIPNGRSNDGPDNNGFGSPAPHDPFTRRMTDAEVFESANYLAGNRSGYNFGKLNPKVEAVENRRLLDDTFGNGSSRRPSFGQPGGMTTPPPPNPLGGRQSDNQQEQNSRVDFGQPGSSFGTPPSPNVPPSGNFGPPSGAPIPPNPLDQQPSGSDTPTSDGPEKKTGLAGRLWNNIFKEADQVQKDSQSFNQQGRMADSFVAEHNARQQSVPGFGGQSFGQSFGQPKNDGPQMGF